MSEIDFEGAEVLEELDVDMAVAAEVSGNEAGKFIVWKEYGFENSEIGTDFVIRSDVEDVINEACRKERTKTVNEIFDKLEEFAEDAADNWADDEDLGKRAAILDSFTTFEKKTREELIDDVEGGSE